MDFLRGPDWKSNYTVSNTEKQRVDIDGDLGLRNNTVAMDLERKSLVWSSNTL
jgi:septum formation inhibitor-activating ATPase MinD